MLFPITHIGNVFNLIFKHDDISLLNGQLYFSQIILVAMLRRHRAQREARIDVFYPPFVGEFIVNVWLPVYLVSLKWRICTDISYSPNRRCDTTKGGDLRGSARLEAKLESRLRPALHSIGALRASQTVADEVLHYRPSAKVRRACIGVKETRICSCKKRSPFLRFHVYFNVVVWVQ